MWDLRVDNFLQNLPKMKELLKRLEHEYDLYFGGGRKFPPTKEHQELDRAVKFYGRITLPNTYQQYLFQNFQQTYSLYSSRWHKMMELKLNGITNDPRLAFRVRADLKTFSELEKGLVKEEPTIKETPKIEGIAKKGEEKKDYLYSLFEEYNRKKQEKGQTLELDPEKFKEKLEKQKKELMEKHKAKDVLFSVQEVDGKVTIKAKIIK